MKRIQLRSPQWLCLAAALLSLLPFADAAEAAKPVRYLSTLLDERNATAGAVTETGAICGTVHDEVLGSQPYYWVAAPGRRSIALSAMPLSTGLYEFGFAEDIKNDDPENPFDGEWICGTVRNTDFVTWRAAVWTAPNQEPTVLPLGTGGLAAQAFVMGESGVVLGRQWFEIDGVRGAEAVAWGVSVDEAGTHCLGPISLGTNCFPSDINRHDQAVGRDADDDAAILWDIVFDPHSATLSLADLGVIAPGTAYAINDAGFIAGSQYTETEGVNAWALDPSGTPMVLKSLPNPNYKGGNPNEPPPEGFVTVYEPYRASAINNLSVPQIAGSLFYTAGIWQGDQVLDLREAVRDGENYVADPTSINDASWVVGNAGVRAVLMIPEAAYSR